MALAVAAMGMLFVAYGTAFPRSPFSTIALSGPTSVDSNGNTTAIIDTESSRALILDADNDLTGMVNTTALEAPFDAMTDVCVSNGAVYLSGIKFAPDHDEIEEERVAKYDTGGNFLGIVYEKEGKGETIPSIKSICDVPGGFAIATEMHLSRDTDSSPIDNLAENLGTEQSTGMDDGVVFEVIEGDDAGHMMAIAINDIATHDAALSDKNGERVAALSIRGMLEDNVQTYDPKLFEGHVFTAIDIDDLGILYACDDETGGLFVIDPSSSSIRMLVEGNGYEGVHENAGVISLCDTKNNGITLCDTSGAVLTDIRKVKLSTRLFTRSFFVWASGVYLIALLVFLGIRQLYRKVKNGDTEGFAPMLLAMAVVSATALAVGNLTLASYNRELETRADVLNMCADYLEKTKDSLSEPMERVNDRNAIRRSEDQLDEVVSDLLAAAGPSLKLIESADQNNIGMYCALYGKDEQGAFYLYDSAYEYVMGTSASAPEDAAVIAAFEDNALTSRKLHRGRTLRDVAQYRLIQIPTADGTGVAGVIEIGIKLRTLDSYAVSRLVRGVLALLVMMLVVYLTYTELRECIRCMFWYRQHRQEDVAEATALLTRPFTFAVTILTSIDSVMTVLIAQDLLQKDGLGGSSQLLAIPAVMLGVGLVIGQGLYGVFGSRTGLRRLAAYGALVMLLCSCLTSCTVAFGNFWLYCAAKLAMSVPFGMLYSLGYSLPRLARSGEVRSAAAGGVKRTDTSAAALGTVLGGYAAQTLGNVGVYALIAIACLPVILMVLNLIPKGTPPLEALAQPDERNGRITDFLKTPVAFALAFFILLPATVASGYASFLFPLFSSDLGLLKADVNNIVVLGQVIVFACIALIEYLEGRYGRWLVSMVAIALLGVVFLLFSVKTTLVWSVAVIALVGLLSKSSDGWKGMWFIASGEAGVPTGSTIGSMFVARSLALIARPFMLGALLDATDSVAVTVLGAFCVCCALLFFLVTRSTSLAPRWVIHSESR